MPVTITKENFEAEITNSKLPVVIDAFAPWCGPCQQMTPIFAEMEKELGSQYKFANINVDVSRDLSIQFGVTSIPTFIFIKNNQVAGKVTGYMSKDDLTAKIKESLG